MTAGWTVSALYEDEGKKKGTTQWIVCERRGDLVQRHRFETEAEARAFAGQAVAA